MTISPRIPSTTGSRLMLGNLQGVYGRLVELQDQLSSGKQLRRPSDGPAGTISALDYRSQLRRSQQYERNTSDAQSWLNNADSTLTTAQTYLQRVRDLTVQGLNASSDFQARAAIANEVREMRDGLIQLANTTVGEQAIFAGTVNTTSPFGPGGQPDPSALADPAAFAATIDRPVGPGVTVTVNAQPDAVFGQWNATVGAAGGYSTTAGGPANLFQELTKLADDIEQGNISGTGPEDGARYGLTRIDAARDRMSAVQAELGARAKRVDDVLSRNSQVSLDLQASLADVEDIDLPKTIIDVKTQEMAYQAALNATSQVIQPSLLDFLR